MTQRTPTSDPNSTAAAPAVSSGVRCRLTVRFWPILVALMLWAGAVAGHAASAVVTFTNFPPAVSNTYNGVITLQINGLTNGVTNVVVQKFLDANTNGVIDAGDLLVQQFELAVGQTRVFTNGATQVTVTNFMPADMTSVTGQITAPLNFQNGDFMQNLTGHYLYKISSPLGQFTPVTNLFIVTNAFPSSMVTGMVENASSSDLNVSNAVVLLLSIQNGSFNVVGGAVANNAGNYALGAPPGTYELAAARSNFVANLAAAPEFNIYANFTNGVTLSLYQATTNITGKALNAATNSIGVPGLLGLAQSTNDYLSLYFTDTNGNFTASVTASNAWVIPLNTMAASFEGYLTWETNRLLNITNNGVNITNTLPPANAIFYGTVTNNSGGALPGVFMDAIDSAGRQSSALTDQHGNYVLGAVGETNQWLVGFPSANNPGLTNNYIFSPGYVQTNINAGQAIQANFTLALAPYTISGSVEDVDGNRIANAQIMAAATNIDGLAYQAFSATTDASGDYSLNVAPGTWTVSVSTNSLQSLGYTNYPASQTVQISDANATVNFTLLVCGEIQILTTNLPNATVGSYYDTVLAATSCNNITNWSTAYGITLTSLYDQTNITYPPGTAIYSDSQFVGYLESYFAFGYTVDGITHQPDFFLTNIDGTESSEQGNANKFDFANLSATVTVSGPIATNITIQFGDVGTTWTALPTTQNGSTYTTVLTNALYTMTWNGEPQTYWATNGYLLTKSGNSSNTIAFLGSVLHSQATAGSLINLASQTPYTGSNNAVVWLKSGTNTPGQYLISPDGPQATNLPPGLTLYPDGTIQGTPTSAGTNGGTFNFTVAAIDISSNVAIQPLSIFVYPATTISVPGSQSSSLQQSNTFNLQVNGVTTGLNYTVLMSTNLASTNWTSLFTTNAVNTNSFLIPDANATNQARFYRIEIGP